MPTASLEHASVFEMSCEKKQRKIVANSTGGDIWRRSSAISDVDVANVCL